MFPVAVRVHLVKIVVAGGEGMKVFLGFQPIIQKLALPERNHLVSVAVNDQHWTSNVLQKFRRRKFELGKQTQDLQCRIVIQKGVLARKTCFQDHGVRFSDCCGIGADGSSQGTPPVDHLPVGLMDLIPVVAQERFGVLVKTFLCRRSRAFPVATIIESENSARVSMEVDQKVFPEGQVSSVSVKEQDINPGFGMLH